jgi:peptidoglycan/LPS O-acetylase OafA/YrhL
LIRVGAALLVALYHLAFYWPARKIGVFSPGWVGVQIFFVLSGFVIAFSADGREVGKFLKGRAARLYPAALICSTIIFLLFPQSRLTYLRSVVLFPVGPWIDGVFWTLPIEMAFYLLVAVTLWRGWPLHKLAIGLGVYSAGFWVLKAALWGFADFSGLENGAGYLTLLQYGAFFALGMCFYARLWMVAVALGLICFVALAWQSSLEVPGAPFWVAPVIWAAASIAIASCIHWNAFVARVLDRVPTRTLGLMTYPLYLVHSAVGKFVQAWVAQPTLALLIGLLASLLVAFAVLPFEDSVRQTFRLPRQSAPATLP